MEEMTAKEREIDRHAALRQFLDLYAYLTDQAIVYLLPSKPGLRTRPCLKPGIVLPHLADRTFVGATAPLSVRAAGGALWLPVLRADEFPRAAPAEFFEGEADLKHLRDNLYVGAHGLRTSIEALDWFENEFGMEVIPLQMEDPYLYHLDCCLLPLTSVSSCARRPPARALSGRSNGVSRSSTSRATMPIAASRIA